MSDKAPMRDDASGIAEIETESYDEMPAIASAQLLPDPQAEAPGPRLAYSADQHRHALRQSSDRELLLALKNEDEAALDELMDRKTGPLIQTVYRILHDREDARDIVQITFVRLWEHRDRYDQKWAPNTWIYRIATNLAIDHLRSRQSKQRQADPLRLHVEDHLQRRGQNERSHLGEREVMAIFEELSAELTEKQRSVFVLREVEGLASKEVAEIVGCRESTVRNHLFNARKTLRQALVQRYPEYAPADTDTAHKVQS
ncbi:MAG: RNA polymerase sigma factor [Thermoanaerobaculia bacterium]|nr:RNA polymerase sigma factor [Thermoanaerobaculia bacterium]